MKKLLIGVITAGMLLVGATGVLAAVFKSPAGIYADLKGITAEDAYTERAAGNSFGQLADEAGVLDEFRSKMLENREAVIRDRVADGRLTQEQADAIIKNMEANQALCDETGITRRGKTDRMGGSGYGMKGALGQGIKGANGFRGAMANGSCWRIQASDQAAQAQ